MAKKRQGRMKAAQEAVLDTATQADKQTGGALSRTITGAMAGALSGALIGAASGLAKRSSKAGSRPKKKSTAKRRA